MDVEKAVANMLDNLEKNTGKTLNDWKIILQSCGVEKHGEMVKFLKQDYALTHGFANMIVLKFRSADAGSAENSNDLVDAQYNGKEDLKLIYNELVKTIEGLGTDVKLVPKKAYISVIRKKQFAIIQPSTKTRLDLGLNIKNLEPIGKLEKSGSFNAMCSHRIRLETISDIDNDVINWLELAYQGA